MSKARRSKVAGVEILPGPCRETKNEEVTAGGGAGAIKDSNNRVHSKPTTDSSASATGAPAHAARHAVQIRDTSTEEWQAARNLEADIKQAISAGPLSESTVGDLATRWAVSRATAWRRVARYQKSGDLTALLKYQRGLTTGASLLPARSRAVIQQIAHSVLVLGGKRIPDGYCPGDPEGMPRPRTDGAITRDDCKAAAAIAIHESVSRRVREAAAKCNPRRIGYGWVKQWRHASG